MGTKDSKLQSLLNQNKTQTPSVLNLQYAMSNIKSKSVQGRYMDTSSLKERGELSSSPVIKC